MASQIPNPRLRAVRKGMNLSQDAFAASLGRFMREELHCNVSPNGNLVGMWERGEVRPSQVYRVGLMAYTGQPEWDLGLVQTYSGRASGHQEDALIPHEHGSRVAHDESEASWSIIATGMSLSGLALQLRPDLPDRISLDYVAEVRDTAEAYRAHIDRYGASDMVRRDVASLLDRCAAALAAVTGHALRVSLMRSVADAADLAAYACRDLLLPGLAQQYYLLGLQAARRSEDVALTRYLLARFASHNIEAGRPEGALACLDVVRRPDIAEGTTRSERSNHLAIEAWACARAGLAVRAIRAANWADSEAVHEEDRNVEPWQARDVSEADLFGITGAAFTELAAHDPQHAGEAIRRLSKSLELRRGDARRNKTLDFVSLAEACLAADDIKEAIQATADAIESAGTTSSQRARLGVNKLRERLSGHVSDSDLHKLFLVRQRESP
jgi:transcriptional regulator with XRE-family HTH domain